MPLATTLRLVGLTVVTLPLETILLLVEALVHEPHRLVVAGLAVARALVACSMAAGQESKVSLAVAIKLLPIMEVAAVAVVVP